MTAEEYREENPAKVEAALRHEIPRFNTYSEGWYKSWFSRFNALTAPARNRLWSALREHLSSEAMEYVSHWYAVAYPHRKVGK